MEHELLFPLISLFDSMRLLLAQDRLEISLLILLKLELFLPLGILKPFRIQPNRPNVF